MAAVSAIEVTAGMKEARNQQNLGFRVHGSPANPVPASLAFRGAAATGLLPGSPGSARVVCLCGTGFCLRAEEQPPLRMKPAAANAGAGRCFSVRNIKQTREPKPRTLNPNIKQTRDPKQEAVAMLAVW